MFSKLFIFIYAMKVLFGSLILLISFSTVLSSEEDISFSIGKYNAGCVKNSRELPETGTGYQVIRVSRERNYANSEMIEYIKKLSENLHNRFEANLLIADISKKGGGPILDDHSSHQTGLDADILYLKKLEFKELYSLNEREKLHPVSKLGSSGKEIDFSKWSYINGEMLKEAAGYSEVDRIFVNPAVKKHLCDSYPGEKWLKKIRPWWGHDGHFHVRLKCPENNSKCRDLSTPGNIECGAKLDWWFSEDARLKLASRRSEPKTEKDIDLPAECKN